MADPGNNKKSGAVEEVKLSLISDDALVANSAEIPLEYHTDPSRPFTSSRPRDEESELPELADKLVVQVGASCPRRPVATSWWNMAKHLSWSLLGLADLDKLNSVDNPSVSLIHLLHSFFLIVAVILLVNMMIALLSNTYQQVQDNSLQEWSFERAITVRTYSSYPSIPVPFNLLSVPLRVFWRTRFDSPALDEQGRSRTLDNLVNKLQKTYFQKYGYECPLTEEKKIDYLVQENEGIRNVTNQIARQVFRPRGIKEDKLTFGQGAWYDSQGIAVDGCLLTYLGPEFCRECKKRGYSDNHHSAKFKSPYTPETPRLEVLIQETGERRLMGLGVVYESYNCHLMPGWRAGTVGYHVDDGKIFEGESWQGREVEGMGYLDNRCQLSTTVFTEVAPHCKFVPNHLRVFFP